jgi:hypothetical protein
VDTDLQPDDVLDFEDEFLDAEVLDVDDEVLDVKISISNMKHE